MRLPPVAIRRWTRAPPQRFREFGRRLAELEFEHARTSAHHNRSPRWARFSYWAAIASAAAVCAILLIVMYQAKHLPTVSAKDILDQATIRRRAERNASARLVVCQKVRIRFGAEEFKRTIYRDLVGQRNAERWDGVHAGRKPRPPRTARAVEQRFGELALDWNDPVSPEVFANWHDRHADLRRDAVTKADQETIVTSGASSGPIRSATLHLRTSDLHPTSELLTLADSQSLEISEIEYRLTPLDQIAEEMFPSPVAATAVPVTAPEMSDQTVPVDAEMNARYALYSLGADLDEEIAVTPGFGKAVEVDGIVSTEERRSQIQNALADIPGVVTHLKTIEEARRAQAANAAPRLDQAPAAAESRSDILSDRIGDPLERESFVADALDSAQKLLAHTLALKRLAERFPPEQELDLSSNATAILRRMISGHIDAIRQTAVALKGQLSKAFHTESHVLEGGAERKSWQFVVVELASGSQRVDADVVSLFTKDRDSDNSKSAPRNLGAVLSELERIELRIGQIEQAASGRLIR